MRDLKRGRTAQAQVIVDAADPLASSAALSGAALAGRGPGRRALAAARAAARRRSMCGSAPGTTPASGARSYIVPGIIGVLLSLTLVLITSMAIVRERERGTLEQLIVTPIDKTSLMLGKILPFAADRATCR